MSRLPGLVCAMLLTGVASLSAQTSVIAAGRVLLPHGADTIGVAGARVVLHRVGRQAQGPIDSTIASPRGEFRFSYRPDTSAVYLLSSGYAGIEYFSTPLHTDPELPDTGLVLFVSDTSSTEAIHVASRHLVISKPAKDGTRAALEIVVLENDGTRTRVAPDSLTASWGARLPTGVVGFQVGQGDIGPDGLLVRHDSVVLISPVAPGQKQLLYTYSIPASPGRIRLPVGDSIAVANILLEEFDRHVTGGGIVRADSQAIEGRSFRQWAGPVPAGSIIEIDFPGDSTGWILQVLVGAVALTLASVGVVALRRRPAPRGSTPQSTVLDQLARLDARYAGCEAQLPPEEWQAYHAERARLKAELSAQLAAKSTSS
ncbi:MAG: hypothetical protein ABI742_14195 [Gemmatimonadota bacterium]